MGRKKQEVINNSIRDYIDSRYKIVPDTIRLNRHNTMRHEIAKAARAFELMKEGKTILTEVIFIGGGRGDIFVPEDYRVIEILASETEKEALEKTQKYPFGLDISYEFADEVLEKIR